MKKLGGWLKKNWLHFVMIVVLFLVSLIYFSPVLEGYTINQADITNWIGSAKDVQDHRAEYEEEPLWSTGSFLGMSSENITLKTPGNVLKPIMKAVSLWLPVPANFLFLYFISFYIMMVCFKVKPWVAAVGAIAFGFSSYFIVILEAGHNTKATAIAFMPAVIGGAYQALRGKLWLGVGISALFFALQIYSNHPQITYYLGMVIGFIVIVEVIRVITEAVKNRGIAPLKKFLFGSLGLLFAYSLAIGVNYGRLSMVKDAAEYTTRGPSDLTIDTKLKPIEASQSAGLTKEYITQWSYGHDETFTLLVPNAKGGESGLIANDKDLLKKAKDLKLKKVRQNAQEMRLMTYFGDQPFTSGPVYFGAFVILLALLGLVYVKTPWKWAILSAAVLTTMLSWGSNFIGLSDYILLQLTIVLFSIGIQINHKIAKYVFLGLSALVFIITAALWGTSELGLTDFFIESVPLYNKFRAVTMILSIGAMCLPLLATLFISEIVKDKEKIAKNPLPLYLISGVFVIFMIVFIVAPDSFVDLYSSAETAQLEQIDQYMVELNNYAPEQQSQIKNLNDTWVELGEFRESVVSADAIRSFVFVLLGLILVFASIFVKKIKPAYVLPLVGILFLIDLAGVSKRFLNNEKLDRSKTVYKQWIGKDQKEYPLAAYPMDLEIMKREMDANPELSEKIVKAEKLAKSEAKKLDLGRVKVNQGGRAVTSDYTQNYVNAKKFGVLDLNTNYRVLDMTSSFTQSSRASYFHKSFGGYHGAKPRRWQEMVDFHMSRTLSPEILNMSNVKYIIQQPSQQNPTGLKENKDNLGAVWFVKSLKTVESADEEIKSLTSMYEIEDLSGKNTLKVNGEFTNKATIMSSFQVELTEDTTKKSFQLPFNQILSPLKDEVIIGSDSSLSEIILPETYFKETGLTKMAPRHVKIKRLSSFDPSREAIINESFKENVSADSYSGAGTIKMTDFKANEIKYSFSSAEKQFAVFSELYHPVGWKATIDGEEVVINQVDFLLRGLEIPAGEHEIVFTYDIPKYHSLGMINGVLGTVILLLFIFGLVYSQMKSKEKEEA